jgi:hypothetical protein
MSQRDPHARRLPKPVLVLAALACALAYARAGQAAPKDAQALKLDEDAINNDYLATKFADAEKKLKQALALCAKADACSTNVVAQLHRDLGIVYVVASRQDEGKAQFVEALKVDPSTKLPKELSTPEIEQVFSAAKGGGAPAPPPPAPAPPKPAPAPAPGGGADEIVHTPPAESATLTPLPLYAELPEGMSPTKVQVRYKPFGAPDWKTVDMKRMKTGYGVELPCGEIGSTPGDLKYYIQAVGPNGEILATNGTKNAPLKVVVKAEIAGEPPHLPGKPAPKACGGPAGTECPPEFPGCKESKKGAGFNCEADSECQSGQCKNGACFSDEGIETKCDSDTGCEAGQWCNNGLCTSPKKNWFSISIQQDILFAPAVKEVCKNQNDYTCFVGDQYYDGSQAVAGINDEIAAGFTPSTTRVLLGYDRVVADGVMVGARLGYAFLGAGPVADGGKAFFPAHIEARASYWFGADPFIRVGVRPYVVGGLGAGQFDGKVPVPLANEALGVRSQLTPDAWRKVGTFFGTAGFGMMYAIDHDSGVTAELKAAAALPTFGLVGSIQVGYSRGIF